MMSSIFKKKYANQMVLTYDCLSPEEAHKLMDALFAEDMDEILNDYMLDIDLTYAVVGYGFDDENKKKIYSHDLVLFIETPNAVNLPNGSSIEEQLEDDKWCLERIRHMLTERTGIYIEES